MSTPATHLPDPVNEHAAAAYESIRALCHATVGRGPIPPPQVYEVLGNLKCLGYGLTQALRQLSRALAESLTVYAVYEDDGDNPEESIAYAMESLRAAADRATQLAVLLDAAQDDLSRIGIHQQREPR
ncbi:MAG: hypothetical protein L0H79_09030 [Intrasporangium sp.]|uniref:hypothetical protein n=1 Tax=Intrasporangium sp. TaxID=1925024 RepID=UPI002649280A|nr:hypothetical protein [Intrasporangium sp.]MDN5795879.1 hypothetical protein [Intrasporangium sp.]